MTSRSGTESRLGAVAGATVAIGAGISVAGSPWLWAVMAAASVVSILLAWRADGAELRGHLRPDRRNVSRGVGGGVAMIAVSYVAYPAIASAWPKLGESVAAHYGALHAPPGPILALPILLLTVAAEELVWRGVLLSCFPGRWPAAAVIGASAAFYALPQLASLSPLLIVVSILCGIVWGAQRVWTGSLIVPLVTHAMWSAAIFALVPLTKT